MKNIKIILSGGGTRCAYQYKILEELINSGVINDINIDSVSGTSFGSFVGLYFCLGKLDLLHDFFMNIKPESLIKSFDLWGYDKYVRCLPIVGSIIDLLWLTSSIKNKGFYKPDFGINELNKLNLVSDENIEKLKKFYCSVYNVTKGKLELIRGDHPLIKEYIVASCALWIVFPPVKICRLVKECDCDESCIDCQKYGSNFCHCSNDKHRFNEFIDAGFIEQIPFKYDDEFNGHYYLLVTKNYDKIRDFEFPFDNLGKHMFEYLDNIITYQSNYIQANKLNNDDCWQKPNVTIIDFKGDISCPTVTDENVIKGYMKCGEKGCIELIESIRKI